MNYFALIVIGFVVVGLGCQRAAEGAERNAPRAAGNKPAASTQSTTQPAGEGVGHVEKTDAEWRKILTPMQYAVLRQKATERPFTGEYDHTFQPGTYVCAACGLELFSSDTKFDSRCGWPAFYAAKAGDRVKLTPDNSHGMHRIEVTCARCGGHLGHIFDDAPQTPTGNRFCINSVSLKFIPAAKTGENKGSGEAPAGGDAKK
jgi:peptide-methionine (R)-S-oxide reductase